MADPTVNDAAKAASEPRFESFDRFPREIDRASINGFAFRRLAETVADVADGVRTVLEITMDDRSRAACRENDDVPSVEDRPLLERGQIWNLQRLALRAMDHMDSECQRLITWACEHHKPESRPATLREVASTSSEETHHG